MAEIRLSKLTKQFSIGLARLVDFLNEKGANVEMNPNAKVSDEFLPAIEAKFGEDLKLKKDSEKVTIKLKEIIELGSKKKPGREEEEVPEREVIIKSNALNTELPKTETVEEKPVEPQPEPIKEEKPVVEEPVIKEEPKPAQQEGGLKIVDKIDLSQFEKKKTPAVEEKPAPEPVAEPETAPTPAVEPVKTEEPAAPAVEEKKEEPKAEEKPQPREVKIEVERLAGPKVVDKIDLSQFDKKKKKKKRERIGKEGSQKVDVTKVEADNKVKKDKNNNKPGGNNAQQQDCRQNQRDCFLHGNLLYSNVTTTMAAMEIRQLKRVTRFNVGVGGWLMMSMVSFAILRPRFQLMKIETSQTTSAAAAVMPQRIYAGDRVEKSEMMDSRMANNATSNARAKKGFFWCSAARMESRT